MQKAMTYPILVQDLFEVQGRFDVLNDANASTKEILADSWETARIIFDIFGGFLIFGKKSGLYKYGSATELSDYLRRLGFKESEIEKYAAYLKKHGTKCDLNDVDCIIDELDKAGLIGKKEKVKLFIKKLLQKHERKIKMLTKHKGKIVAVLLVTSIVAIVGLAYKWNLIPGDRPWSFDFYKHLIEKLKRLPRQKQALLGVIAGIALASFAYLGYKAAKIAAEKIIKLIKQLAAKVKAKMGRA